MRCGIVLLFVSGAFAQDWKAKLASVDPAERVRAAGALERAGAAQAVPELAECLVDADAALRVAAARALGSAGPAAAEALPALERLLRDPDVRGAAWGAIVRIADTEAVADLVRRDRSLLELLGSERLRALLGARSWHVRLWVLQSKQLKRADLSDWVPRLDALAQRDPAEVVRMWAAVQLNRCDAAAVLPLMQRRLRSKDARERAIGLVGTARRAEGSAQVLCTLEPLLTDPVPQIRARACLALRDHAPSAGAMARLLDDAEPHVRATAAVVSALRGRWTKSIGAPVVQVADVGAIRAPFPVVSLYRRNLRAGGGSSIWTAHERYPPLGAFARKAILGGGEDAVPYVAHALESERDARRRIGLLYALGHLGAADALQPLLKDPERAMRRRAAACRVHLGSKDAASLAILIACLADPHPMEEDEEELEEEPIETGARFIHWPETAFPLLVGAGEPVVPLIESIAAKAITPVLQRQRLRRLAGRIRAGGTR